MMTSLFKIQAASSFGCPNACLAQDRVQGLSESSICDSDMEPSDFGSCEVFNQLQGISEHIVFLHETECLLNEFKFALNQVVISDVGMCVGRRSDLQHVAELTRD